MTKPKILYREKQIADRVKALGREISRDFEGQTLDVVCRVDTGHIFMADLVRAISVPVRTHFMSMSIRKIVDPRTRRRREQVFFYPEINGRDRTLLVVDGVLQTGITLDFVLRLMWQRAPKDVKSVILVDKVVERRVDVAADYVGFELASNDIVVGYGLAWKGLDGNLPYLAKLADAGAGSGKARKGKKKTKSANGRRKGPRVN